MCIHFWHPLYIKSIFAHLIFLLLLHTNYSHGYIIKNFEIENYGVILNLLGDTKANSGKKIIT